jgi:hypothetical protein
MKATFALSLLSNPGLGDREASGVRSGVVDLFPKDENRETEVSRGFRFLCLSAREQDHGDSLICSPYTKGVPFVYCL